MSSLKQFGAILFACGSTSVLTMGIGRAETSLPPVPVPSAPEATNGDRVGQSVVSETPENPEVRETPPSAALSADDADGSPGARAFFERGLALADEKDFNGARAEFQKALDADPPLEAYFGLGQVELALGNPCSAVKAYADYLRVGGGRISASVRRQVEFHILQLRQGSAADATCHPEHRPGTLVLHCDAPGARMRLNGRDVSRFPGAGHQVDAGRHEVEFYDGVGSWRPVSVEVEPGSIVHVQCAAGPSLGTDSPDAEGGSQFTSGEKVALAITGTGLGFAVATLSHFFWNLGRHEAWESEHERLLADGGGSLAEQERHDEFGDSITNASKVTVGLGIASGVLTATGITLYYFESKKGEGSSALTSRSFLSTQLGPGSASLSFQGAF